MKGLILAGGIGSRLRPLTIGLPKHLVPLLGKALIEYPIEHLTTAGVKEIGIIISYLGELIKEFIKDGKQYGASITYLKQDRRLGIAHAINIGIESGFLNNEFVVYLGDNILAKGISEHIIKFKESPNDVFILLSKVKDPKRFGVAIIKDNKVIKLVEKPQQHISDYAVVGVYMFKDPDLVSLAFRNIKPSWRGEYEITDLIQWFIDKGYSVGYDIVEGWWKDVGTHESLLEAIYLLLDDVKPRIEGEVNGEVIGRVVVEKKAIVNGIIFGPAYIGEGVTIEKGAKIEHYVSLEKKSKIISGSIVRSLVMDNSIVNINEARLVESIIGRNAEIIVNKKNFNGDLKLLLSDYSKVSI